MRLGIPCLCCSLLSLGCGSTQPTGAKNASSSGPGDPSSSSTPESGTASEPAGETRAFHAEVVGITNETEGVPYKSVKMLFKNPSGKACEVSSYELEWPGGKKLVNGERSPQFEKFMVPAGASRQRSLRVHPSDGDIATLDTASAKLKAECN